MNDPHVVALIYHVNLGSSVDYSKAEPLYVEESEFRLVVKDKKARFELKQHYATATDAKEAIQDYIRKWEFDAYLNHGPSYFQLEYSKPEIVDRMTTPGVITIHALPLTGKDSISKGCLVTCPFTYPSPPSDIRLNSHIEAMYQQYVNYCRGREGTLLSMAYFCLTVVENLAQPPVASSHKRKTSGKRLKAAQKYNISQDVLNEIGRLVSTRGGPIEARKEEGSDRDLTLTPDERRFLEQAIKKLIRRVAEKTHDRNKVLPVISLSDFPPI